MTWNKAEALIIKDHGRSLKTIETALIGDIEKQSPGMIDDINGLKSGMVENKKQHKLLFSLIGSLTLLMIYQSLVGTLSIDSITKMFTNILKVVF